MIHPALRHFDQSTCHRQAALPCKAQLRSLLRQPLPAMGFQSPRRRTTISHIVSIKTEVRDAAAIHAACQRLGLAPPVNGQHKLFTSTATGIGIKLPGWSYPVVCDLSTGQIAFDNYNGSWGEQVQLAKFLQSYAVERAKIEARKQGHTVTEQSLASGEIKLTIHVGGGAA